ncbi:CCA tRNA nucleotidyltransferase [Metabacillus halosaccharovorans]|uniref:CCA-adding enzyme n=1 Tax=Metabacillus halosaccharovorans TaxID=930124 RepID=A0ABT3DMT2_9BACI|nr:CCA tRNA nucleotidyltransferase [Metabacillus halosaccharovorans]MCV9888375.1 CCA tRNA nucleotidyltransferase [Metabacillus halosaccharovorans]
METPFDEAKPILDKLHQSGFEAYFVGGAVRDFLLGREIGDIDIATSAKPEDIKNIFPKTIDVGAEHGTIIVLHEKDQYEVTTYRTESGYEDFRRPQNVQFITSLKEDLRRRDFTINAMAMNINGEVFDYFHGKDHMEQKLIHTVDSPKERFNEDALRMLRALRFVSQLHFTLSFETEEAIKHHVHLLDAISIERKTTEIEKLLKGVNVKSALNLVIQCKVYNYLPGFVGGKVMLEKLSSFPFKYLTTREEFWTVLTYYISPSSVEIFLRKWKLPNKLINSVKNNLSFLTIQLKNRVWTDLLLYEAGLGTAIAVERIRSILLNSQQIDENVSKLKVSFTQLPIKTKKEIAVNGHDLIKWKNKEPGPWVAQVMEEIEKAILLKRIENKRSEIKEWLSTCSQDFDQNY